MGIYDREYFQEEDRGLSLGGSRTMVANLILLNVGIFLVDMIVDQFTQTNWISDVLAVKVGDLPRPWMWWHFLTAGFAHSPDTIWHIGVNMLALFFFGRPVEALYGRYEFLRLYLSMVIFASITWCLIELLRGTPSGVGMYGASGAVTGILVLFALHYPRQTVYLMFLIPVPAWIVAVMIIVMDFLNAIGGAEGPGNNVANTAHLAGAVFAFIYWRQGWNLGQLTSGIRLPRRRPRLRIHEPSTAERNLNQKVDAILEKISREGKDSLTREERRTLEDASRRYQRRRS